MSLSEGKKGGKSIFIKKKIKEGGGDKSTFVNVF
jgi:hypothetical protein